MSGPIRSNAVNPQAAGLMPSSETAKCCAVGSSGCVWSLNRGPTGDPLD
jgi:hypothetical protein